MLASLFPDHVVQHSIRIDSAEARARVWSTGIGLPASLAHAVAVRQVQFLAGRYCAVSALRALSPALRDIEIPIGPHREPVWPRGFVGSITHTSVRAAAAVASTRHARGLGFDIEAISEGTESSLFASADEMADLRRQVAWNERQLALVVFSAKESLFKCLYPLVGRYFDFLDARVCAIDSPRASLTIELLQSLSSEFRAGFALEGRFEIATADISTGFVLG